jgi:beta-N-acetylhexosaminidase
LVLATLVVLAAGAFAIGAALGDGRSPTVSLEVQVAETLPPSQLAGQRIVAAVGLSSAAFVRCYDPAIPVCSQIVAGLSGTAVPPALRDAIRRGEVAGVVLFAANFPSRKDGRRLIRQLQGIRRPMGLRDPLLVMVDQEGGLVKRLSGAPSASAAQMGARGAAFSREQGRLTAANLRDAGVNVDLAPVLDVARPGGTIAETERGFAATAQGVAATAIPFAEGLQAGAVAAAGKHFPGFGAATENTDFAVEQIAISKARLRQVDEAPYRAFADAE